MLLPLFILLPVIQIAAMITVVVLGVRYIIKKVRGDTTRNRVALGWIGSLCGVLAAVWFIAPPLNPFGDLFDPKPPPLSEVQADNFTFESFGKYRNALQDALKKIIPVGTPKEHVDDLLVNRSGATCPLCDTAKEEVKQSGAAEVYYFHRVNGHQDYFECRMTWSVGVIYDQDLTVEKIGIKHGPCT